MSNGMKSYLVSLHKTIDQCSLMVDLEQQKRQALLSNNINLLENMLQSQQAEMMKLESLEKQRVSMQEAAGFGEMTGSEILAKLAEGPEKEEFSRAFSELKNTAEELKNFNKQALDIAKESLKMYSRLTPGIETPEKNLVYKADHRTGAKWGSGSTFEEKI